MWRHSGLCIEPRVNFRLTDPILPANFEGRQVIFLGEAGVRLLGHLGQARDLGRGEAVILVRHFF